LEGAGEGQIFLGDSIAGVMSAEPEGHLIPDIMDFGVVAELLGDDTHLIDEDQSRLEILKPIGLQQLKALQPPSRQADQGHLDLFGGQGGAHENSLFEVFKGVNAGLSEHPYCE
jgi:hypothetical protein